MNQSISSNILLAYQWKVEPKGYKYRFAALFSIAGDSFQPQISNWNYKN